MATEDLICDGPVTKKHLEEILQQYFKTDNKLVKADGVVISEGTGFTSNVMRVKLEWEVKNGLPAKVIVKAPKIERLTNLIEHFGGEQNQEAIDATAALGPQLHKTECGAYEILKGDNPVPIPNVYGFRLIGNDNPGVIVMEDLGDRAMLIGNAMDGPNVNQWQSIIEHVADLHAWSLTTETQWKEKIGSVDVSAEFFKNFNKNAATSITSIKERYSEYFGHIDEENVLKEISHDAIMEQNLLHKKFMPDVLQHGDTNLNNIMFEKNPDGTISDKVVAFIDWQGCSPGSGINDIARLESFFLNHEIRQRHGARMLRQYYDRFKSRAGDKLTATFEQIEYLYRKASAVNNLLILFFVDFMMEQISKVKDGKSDLRKQECLSRMKAGYDDAAKHYGWTAVKPLQ